MRRVLFVLAAVIAAGWHGDPSLSAAEPARALHATDASPAERFAAHEVRRYVYVRTGVLWDVEPATPGTIGQHPGVFVGRADHEAARAAAKLAGIAEELPTLTPQAYRIKTAHTGDRTLVVIIGGDDAGALYGAYRFARHLGVRFFLHGDVIPETPAETALPDIDEHRKPLFDRRGIQPFHDFPEGPDWWNVDGYKAVLAQLPKLGMNFFGLHTYPQGGVGPEPTVWIGPADEVAEDGNVNASYRSRHFTTVGGTWGSKAKPTSQYAFGTGDLFDRDDYGADYMRGMTPWPESPDKCNELFNRVGALLRDAFTFARALGIKTCVGTETPLTIPDAVKERLAAAGQDPADPAVKQALYAGIFTRIARTHPLDYYWFWTPENWTWRGATDEQVAATLRDLRSAIAAAEAVDAPFTLATCGWVLGPPQDRALFDNELPKTMPMSCINRQVGHDPVEPGFARVSGRPAWAIPWLEDDPALTSPQLWAGRMRRDAFDALRYGCTGLMGIHWRTRILGPNVAALAEAAWDQSGWSDEAAKLLARRDGDLAAPKDRLIGGKTAAFPNNPIADTDEDPIYQTVRWDVEAYHFALPNGRYTVTLKFCEPHHDAAGRRAFDVAIQGKTVIDKLDIFAKVGRNKALDYTFEDVVVDDGRLVIDFAPRTEFPCIAGIVVRGEGIERKLNCGGPAWGDYAADFKPEPDLARHLPADDFYADWATALFGPEAGPPIGALFARLDGKLPRPTTWVAGPGGIQPDPRPWNEVAAEYAFVDELAALRPLVRTPAALERFDYWLNNFRLMRATARVRCAWAWVNEAMAAVEAAETPEAKKRLAHDRALPMRRELIRAVSEVYRCLIPTITTTGMLGNLANWEQHIQPMLLGEPGEKLAAALGEPLPADAMLPTTYRGPMHLFVPFPRTSLEAGEPLRLTAHVLSEHKISQVTLFWKPLGADRFREELFKPVARNVYGVTLWSGAASDDDIEWYVQAIDAAGVRRVVPASAPRLNHTVVRMSRE